MSLEKTDAIVLKTIEWSETSLIVTLLTRDFGKVSAIAKGARRLKSPFESALDLLSLSSVVFLKKSGESLDLLTEAKLLRRFRGAQVGLLPLYCGYYAGELINALTENHEPIPGLLDSLCNALAELDRQADPAWTILDFELQTIQRLGHMPSWRWCVACGEEIETDRQSIAFSPQAGGVLCPNCTSMQRSYMRIRPQTLQALEFRSSQIADWPLANFVAEQPPPPIVPAVVRAEIRLVMEQIVICLSDRRLRMLDYLEDLKR
ncbi:MAG: DNA repair protein RecO [Planctomycetota bacterium]